MTCSRVSLLARVGQLGRVEADILDVTMDHAVPVQPITSAGRLPSMTDGGPRFSTRAILLSNPSDDTPDEFKLAVKGMAEDFESFLFPRAVLPNRVTVNSNP